jgi:hypothetical protein
VRSRGGGGQAKVVNSLLEGRYVSQNSTVKWVLGLGSSVFRGSDNPQAFITTQPQIFILILTLKKVAKRSSETSKYPS